MNNNDYVLTENTIKAIRKIFDQFDLNKNGKIEKNELNNLCKVLGDPLTSSELECALYELDTNNSGLIEWEEFIQYWQDN